ncbi:phage major capsid protein [Anaerococcus sp. AGMB09787]|uniref:phage major capsid protein n=1 Tax=Anaerococcus sp. AGMB09787 TaxID=2922869 RepID=UPI001FB02A81|nr:phage major capsid protein [Anaerococcus sp. AGMB09787]
MAQKFDPNHVMLSDTIGKEIADERFTNEFLQSLVNTSLLIKLGSPVEMKAKMERKSLGMGELSNAYFVGEGEKIGTANLKGKDYVMEAKKIATILPVTEEFLEYSWANYFNEIVPVIADKFNKMIDGAAFLGLHNNPFGVNVLASAKKAKKVITGLDTKSIYDFEALTDKEPNAFVGHRTLNRSLRGLTDDVTKTYIFDRANKTLDGISYEELMLADGEVYPENTLLTGDFSALKYGVPNGSQLRLKIADQATLSKIQNDGTVDSGDVHLFEQDMQALRAVFEIAVAIPVDGYFAAISPDAVADDEEELEEV